MNERVSDSAECWPTARQERLLQAALWQGTDAVRAWEEWQAGVDVMRLDLGSTRLLPLLHQNLRRLGVDDPRMARFKGVARQAWYKNQMLAGRAQPLLGKLRAAGVRTMLLKGAALLSGYYPDYGLRPMSDFDILVSVPQALEAVQVLLADGWTLGPGEIKLPTATTLSLMHSQEYRSEDGQRVDLHWHVFPQCLDSDAEEEFWRGARPTRFQDVETSLPDPADLLMHVCVHGTQAQLGMATMRWVADALTILNKAEIDWDRLLRHARERRLHLPLRDTLAYLARRMNAPIPPEVLERLARMPATRAERREYETWTAPSERRGPLLTLQIECRAYARWARRDGRRERGRSFLHYLQYRWQIDHLWRVPFSAAARALRRGWKAFQFRRSARR